MINELYTLAQALEHHGLLTSTTHPDVGTVGKYQCLLIEIGKDGEPKATHLLAKKQTASLWKHSKGNHSSFPAIRIQSPLLSEEESRKIDGDTWKKLKLAEKQSLLQKLDYSNRNPQSGDILLSDWSRKELAVVLSDDQPSLEALRRLIHRFPEKNRQNAFYIALIDLFRSQLEWPESEVMLDFLVLLLVGKWDSKKGKYIAGGMTYFDIYETIDVRCKVISAETSAALIKLLNSSRDENSTDGEQLEVCALSGRCAALVKDKYPNPKLPLLGLTYLYSKKEDIACLSRYGVSGVGAFPASEAVKTAVNDAIAFLTVLEHKDRTWGAIADSNRENPDLLLAYLVDAPENDAKLAKLLNDPTDQEEMEGAFDELCHQVIGGIKPVLEKNPDSVVNLIILETLDPGRKQIVYGNSFSSKQMVQNVTDWSEASKNHPEILIRFYEKKALHKYHPICADPNKICQLLKMNYSATGSAKPQKASAVSLQDIYRLYMPQSPKAANDADFLNEVLEKTMRRTGDMLTGFKQQMTLADALRSVNPSEVRIACIAISFISILLWRLDVRKENYMIEAPYNIGQFLQLADKLHKEYCVQVRNSGDTEKPLPTQLIGNQMLPIAAENPNEALNRLRERMKIYLGWAYTATGDAIDPAKETLASCRKICAKISMNDIPETFNTAEQAQILLGYLATIPDEKKEDKPHE
jgi:hypothetical protein